jgi:Uma2 family endonuclease
MAERTKTRMTAAEYLALPETMERVELINGVLIRQGEADMTPAPLLDHQRIIRRVARLIEDLMPDGEVFFAPTGVFLDDDNMPEPDVLWIAASGQAVPFEGKYVKGAPDLVVEVLSDGSKRHDKVEKFRLYEKHGVREDWIIDPKGLFVEVFRLIDGKFQLDGVFAPGETFACAVLNNQTIAVAAIFGR